MKKHPIGKFLSSVLLGIVLLGALAIASIWGSLLSSNPAIGVQGARELVFNTWWYTALLGLLVVNLVFCSWDRTVWAIKLWKRASYHGDKRFYHGQETGRKIELDGGLEPAIRLVRRAYTICRVKGNAVHAQKGIVGRLGVPIVHLGVILVLVGGLARMMGDRLGYAVFEAQVVIPESGVVDSYYVRRDRSQALNERNARKVPLGFQLRCLDFDEEKFPHSEVPRSYSSQVEVQDGQKHVFGIITMAHPFYYRGYKFHQTSFAPDEQVVRGMVEIADSQTQKRIALVDVSPGTPVAVPTTPYWFETEGLAYGSRWELSENGQTVAEGRLERPGRHVAVEVERIVPDFRIGADREVFSASDEWKNPAVLIAYYDGDTKAGEDWFFYRPEFRRMSAAKRGEYDFEFVDHRSSADQVSSGSVSAFEVKMRVSRKTDKQTIGSYWLRVGEKLILDEPHATDEVTSRPLIGSEAAAPPGSAPAGSQQSSAFSVRYRGPTMGYDTILGVVKDPSIPITYAGCILVVLGSLLAFFITYRQVWGYYDGDENRLYLALSVRGRSEGPVKEYQRMVKRLHDRKKHRTASGQ